MPRGGSLPCGAIFVCGGRIEAEAVEGLEPRETTMRKKTLIFLLPLSAFVAVCLFGFFALCIFVNPILIISEDPDSIIFVNNKEVVKGTGSFHLETWEPRYTVTIIQPTIRHNIVLDGWIRGGDSESIIVEKKKVSVNAYYRSFTSTKR